MSRRERPVVVGGGSSSVLSSLSLSFSFSLTLSNYYRVLQFYCPAPGCSRSFAELWRLKVHFRAPPDVRGSGKERGHGTELKFCPKCGKELKPGKHHVGCSAGKTAPRQAAKRRRHVSSSEDDPESGDHSSHSSSWQRLVESAVQRRRTRTRGGNQKEGEQKQESVEMVVSEKRAECKVDAGDEIRLSADLLGPGTLDSDLLPNLMDTAGGALAGGVDSSLAFHLTDGIEKLPSPPPLPLDWELGGDGMGQGFLFDFAQFDQAARDRRHSAAPVVQQEAGPHSTAITSMPPQNMSNPSDDYIWQILFANPTDEVPMRVTAHMHNPSTHTAGLDTIMDIADYDPLFSSVLPQAQRTASGHAVVGVPREPPTGTHPPSEGGKKTVTVTYELGTDGTYQVKHVENDDDKSPTAHG